MICFECGEPAACEHHVVPQSRGGTKTVPLCARCHKLAHNFNGNMDHRRLTLEGLAKAKGRGVKLGSARPGHWEGRDGWNGIEPSKAIELKRSKLFATHCAAIVEIEFWKGAGLSYEQIAVMLNIQGFKTPRGKAFAPTTVHQIVTRLEVVD